MTKFGKSSSRVIFLRLCSIQKRPKSSHFGLSCDLCRECRKRDVWLIFFFLSILSSSTCATAAPSDTVTTHLQGWLKIINGSLEVSCPPCEAHTLEPATKFLENFMELLQQMNSQQAGL